MKTLFPLLAFCLGLTIQSACLAQGPTEADIIARLPYTARDFEADGPREVQEFIASIKNQFFEISRRKCDRDGYQNYLASIKRLDALIERKTRIVNVVTSSAIYDMIQGTVNRDILRILKIVLFQRTALGEARLGFADAYLKNGCFEFADREYRTVFRFNGTAFEDLRRRAKLGVDDVRAAKKR